MKKEGILKVASPVPQQPRPFHNRTEKALNPHLGISDGFSAKGTQKIDGTPNGSLRNKPNFCSYAQTFTHHYDSSSRAWFLLPQVCPLTASAMTGRDTELPMTVATCSHSLRLPTPTFVSFPETTFLLFSAGE